ncbi:MAG TPA: hypothetical protein PLU30_23255 [Verrucomicrobiae bacterium]|nr:hypothetical protein [Verrucomicrobiae bacterium]
MKLSGCLRVFSRVIRPRAAICRAIGCAACAGLFWHPCGAADGPVSLRRSEAFFGIHFDFHAGPDCTNVGARTTPQMVNLIVDRVRPDYIQIDCKGHPGYSSYPTKVGNPVPGFVGDPLRVWRAATLKRGVALFMHYSGVVDNHAVASHPEWAALDADGKPDKRATSVFGPYVDRLMVPQLRELAGEYGVDGVWVDGDCWGARPDYGGAVVKAFREKTGAPAAPRKVGEPFWNEWLAFNREGYRRYLRHYVDELKSSHPRFQVISNWAFSDHMPEPVTAGVAALSGDFSPDNSVNSARFAGRCIENQGVPWDLMSWSFSRKTRKQKPAAQLMQEAAVVLAQGGGYQAYFTQDRDGAVRTSEMGVMAEVARFCRARQKFCHHSRAVPQIALLYSTAGHYRSSPKLFHPSGGDGIAILKRALTVLLDAQQAVQIVSEHHLSGSMARWPLIIVPGWGYLEPKFRDELVAYGNAGGRLLLVGPGPAKLFDRELPDRGQGAGPPIVAVPDTGDAFLAAVRRLFPQPLVEVTGAPNVDVSPRRLAGKLGIHLINTSGPHADAPPGGIAEIPSVGPLRVSLRLPRAPKAVTLQPQAEALTVAWADGRATVTVPWLEMYSVLTVEE